MNRRKKKKRYGKKGMFGMAKLTQEESKKYQELISDISTEDIIDAAWDCKSSVPCYKCLHYSVCNKHGIGASAIGLALLRLMELNERVKTLESDRDEWKAKAEALESDIYLISGELEFSAMCKICKYEHGTEECTERFNNHVKQGKDCFKWRGVEKESK